MNIFLKIWMNKFGFWLTNNNKNNQEKNNKRNNNKQ